MVKISKTGFINLIRCNRFAALDEIARNEEDSLVTFTDNMEDLMSLENAAKRNLLLDDIRQEEQQDSSLEYDVMAEYYNKVEILTAKAVKHYFKGELIFSANTFNQANFMMESDGYEFHCFLDGLLTTEDGIKVFETKATTSRKFIAMEAKKESIFKKDVDGILKLKKELGYQTDKAYDRQEAKLFDRHTDVGSYVYDLAFQRYVIEHSINFNKNLDNKYYLAVLNYEYVFDGQYDENNEAIYPIDIITFIDFTQITERYLEIIEKDMNRVIYRLNTMNANPVPLGKHCQLKKNRECKFKHICYQDLPENVSILNYIDNHHGFKEDDIKHTTFELLNNGYKHMLDIPRDWLKRENNQVQYDVVKDDVQYFDKGKIQAGINEIKYPIYHLDFESFPCPLPRFRGEKPYSQSLFQFSIHIEKEPGVCDKEEDHYAFLAKDHNDNREELIKQMLDVIKPDGGSVLVYNISFEKTRIRELGELFPQYKQQLTDISNRLFDLMYIVRTNGPFYRELGYSDADSKKINYYHKDLGGSFSIKKILPLFSDISYDGLAISDGEQAYSAYVQFPKMDQAEFNEAYNNLTLYCQQDTWAMFEVLRELRKIT